MKILVSYRGIPQSPGWATGDMVVKAFRKLGHDVFPYAKYYQQNKWVEDRQFYLDDQVFDLILFMECNDGDPQYPELKVTRARQTAGWFFDTSYHVDRYKKLVDFFRFDHLFLANPLTVQEYKLWDYNNVHYLPYACDRELHERSVECSKTHNVALVGSDRADRRALVDVLAANDVDLQLISGVFRKEYIDALASAHVVINQNPPEGLGLLNMRHFEAQAAGCLVIEQWCDLNPNIESGFFSTVYAQDGDASQVYKDLCARWETHPLDLRQMQLDFFAHNTYVQRCETILETVFPHG